MTLIVVVDDRITNRLIFSQLAAAIREGVEVQAFADPAKALTLLAERRPDLVITDYNMPGMDGAAFIRGLRGLPLAADVPVVVITAHEDREFRLRALEAGATDFLQSPVDHQEFVTRGRNVLRLGEQQRLIQSRADTLERELVRTERSLETAIRDSRTRLLQVIDTIPAAISASDASGRRVFANKYGLTVTGLDAGSQPDGRDQQVLRSGEPILGHEEEMGGGGGERRTMLTSKFPLRDADGVVRHVLTTSFDISERKRAEEAMRRLAHHDGLTGLPNRLALYEALQRELARAAGTNRSFALHLIDLDRFKTINDGFGHDHGDELLRKVAARLLRQVGQGDLVARLGGDEFAVVQVGTAKPEAAALAQQVIQALSEPFEIEQLRACIGASVGITLAPADGATTEQLLKNADLAMYHAKQSGRGQACFFTPAMQEAARRRVLLEIDLRRAVRSGELELWYQPQLDIASNTLAGAEALLRWNQPGHGIVLPGAFLPVAEDTELMVEINRWVLDEACRQMARWTSAPPRVGVNLPAAAFRSDDVQALVLGALRRNGLAPDRLELELTEGTLIRSQHGAAALHELRRAGVRVAVDDFGTGYSSLAYLQQLPIDRLKIDRSFVQALDGGRNGAAIVQAVSGIGRSLGLEVLAEGVETLGQLDRLRDAGCRYAQGYYLGQPVPAGEFERNHLRGDSQLAAQTA